MVMVILGGFVMFTFGTSVDPVPKIYLIILTLLSGAASRCVDA